jgi:WD40 repeat protein
MTRRRCCPMAKCSSQAVITAEHTPARNSTIRRPGCGRPPAASPGHGKSTRATLLSNGKVLIAGGRDGLGYPRASAELYDPATGVWTRTGDLANPGTAHTATLLLDGKVLVAGGLYLASAELYDPASGTWTITGSLATARDSHTAALLPNGQVLVAGGSDSNLNVLASAELYDPASGTWTDTGSLATGRVRHTATLLPSGQVLVAGGFDDSYTNLASAELYTSDGGGEITLSAKVRREHGKRFVALEWSPADGGTIEVLRDGVVLRTVDGDGRAQDHLGSGPREVHTYQVCETDTGDCSNEVQVKVPGSGQ